ncbi:hypothetical protein POM88_041993 [Heracleum sosnowskyi]|uniref:Uncharacterized protein n=1 Tax=Heracleum sosnowskyi TaxID=360622 RepID=A0AAD8HHW7_9APIA|nr:hypothetical protein POM88_041993 [Heracleum sosnowskyi]
MEKRQTVGAALVKTGNIVKAKAALQGVKKGNAKERSGLGKGKGNKDGQEMRRTDQSSDSPESSRHSRDYVDALKAFPRSRQASDEESSAKMSSLLLSAPLSTLLIPSLKEADCWESFVVSKMTGVEATASGSDVQSGNMVYTPILEEGVFRFDCSGDDRNASFPSLSFVNQKDRDTPLLNTKGKPTFTPTFECILGSGFYLEYRFLGLWC